VQYWSIQPWNLWQSALAHELRPVWIHFFFYIINGSLLISKVIIRYGKCGFNLRRESDLWISVIIWSIFLKMWTYLPWIMKDDKLVHHNDTKTKQLLARKEWDTIKICWQDYGPSVVDLLLGFISWISMVITEFCKELLCENIPCVLPLVLRSRTFIYVQINMWYACLNNCIAFSIEMLWGVTVD
jgi:hypothetical protein